MDVFQQRIYEFYVFALRIPANERICYTPKIGKHDGTLE